MKNQNQNQMSETEYNQSVLIANINSIITDIEWGLEKNENKFYEVSLRKLENLKNITKELLKD